MVWPYLLCLPIFRLSLSYGGGPCWVLAAGPHLWWSLCVRRVSSEEAELCLLSLLLLGVGLALVGLFWWGFCASSWGPYGFPQRVLQLVTLSGFRNFLAPVSWPNPAVDVCCWVGGVLVHHLVFYLVPAQLTLSGFCNLSGSSLLAYSCGGALLLGWRCLWCVAWFSTLCSALPPGPAVCAASPAAGSLGDFLPFLSPGACPSATLVA